MEKMNFEQPEGADSFEKELAWCIQKLKIAIVESHKKTCNCLFNQIMLIFHGLNF